MDKLNKSYNLDDLDNLPEKVLKLYNAVNQLVKEGAEIANLTVSEISSMAGIGKGTTYEYFESKEELINKALYYSLYMNTKTVLLIMSQDGDFKSKFYGIMDYMWSNKLDVNSTKSVVNIMRRASISKPDCIDDNDKNMTVIETTISNYLQQGIAEKVFSETDEVFCKYAICSQIIQCILFIQSENDFRNRQQEINDYIYDGLLYMLNKNK